MLGYKSFVRIMPTRDMEVFFPICGLLFVFLMLLFDEKMIKSLLMLG